MTTCAEIIRDALQRNQFLQDGEYPTPNEENGALRKLQAIILSLPGMTHWRDVEASGNYTAGEDERVRVNVSSAVTITVPASVSSAHKQLWCCNQIVLTCSGYDDRAPRDGAKVGVSDAFSDAHVTYFYRSDKAEWLAATDLTRDSEIPLNQDMDQGLTALLCCDLAAGDIRHTLHPLVAQQAVEARAKMRGRYGKREGVPADPVMLSTLANRRYQNWPVGG